MFKNHPSGLFVAFFANMGERFGYYTMLAIFTLFLQAKYGYTAAQATQVFGIFLAAVYFMPLIGGILADRWLGYGKTISIGLVVMFLGYILLAIPTKMDSNIGLVFAGLGVISLGTGLFKGNLQALVGNLYDNPAYSKNRDIAFNIFYMGINIGAMFAPTAAEAVSNGILHKYNFFYQAEIPALANKFLNGDTSVAEHLTRLAQAQVGQVTDLTAFATNYINALSESYHYAFGVACLSLILSMIIFWGFRKYYKAADKTERQKAKDKDLQNQVVELTPEQTKQRLVALGLVFFVVIFFWMAFHQNGAAMTIFARDYVVGTVDRFTNLFFDLFGLLCIFFAILGLVFLIRKKSTVRTRIISGIAFVVFAILTVIRFNSYADVNPFTPQKFQHFNPFFIVALTPLIVGYFGYLNRKGKEPSAPKKIGIGMIITAIAYTIMIIASLQLRGYDPGIIGEVRAPEQVLISPYWLISTYFMLTIAELFLSPMGISFVSRVAPPKYKGLMQGGWLAATAIGNYAVGILGLFWDKLPLWAFWSILVICCALSATFIFSILKRLEAATN
ncbi:MAG: peptide MFS transporter [Candidatus Kapabacteria bacterium]|nr:peptide MFS transporter [Candidatus Kapabacteria bacterium]